MSDYRYYLERAATERAMALAAEQLEVREIHEELARQYDALVEHAELPSEQGIRLPFANRRLAAS